LAFGLINNFNLSKGDRVAMMMPNCIQHTLSYFGINKAGAVAAPVNVMYRERELEYQLNDSGSETIIALDSFYPLIQKVRDSTPLKNIILTNLKDFTSPDAHIPPIFATEKTRPEGTYDLVKFLEEAASTVPEIEIDADRDLSLLLYTAGTTGLPKGVMEAHKLCWAAALSLVSADGITEKDVDLQIMPMFHTSGYNLAQMPILSAGGTVVLVPLFDPKECLEQLVKYKVSIIYAPPTFYVGLVNFSEIDDYDLSNIRISLACGAPTPPPIIDRWKEKTGLTLADGLGLTETHCGSIISGGVMNNPARQKLGTIGPPISEAKIVNENGEILPVGETGELMFRFIGDFTRGYWNKPEETKAAWTEDGWLHTGDAAYVDEEGFFYFVDRYKDLIIASGYNIAPTEIDGIIMQHDAVKEVATIGIPDSYRGQTVKVFVSLKDEYKGKVKEQEIIDFCRDKMATFKVPRSVEFIEEIPKNSVGKIMRRILQEREVKKK
jgi:long-chain acyl-CoA synthetase